MTVGTPRRVKERALVRAMARGLAAWSAGRLAGYHPDGAARVARRLAGEIAKERQKLAGMNGGHAPARFGPKDARRIARQELERLVDRFGPNHSQIVEQTIRGLARQVPKSIAVELLQSYGKKHLKVRRDGGDAVRAGQLVHYAGQLLSEIGKLADAPPDLYIAPLAKAVRQELEQQQAGAPVAPASDRCPDHPSQPAVGCKLCPLNAAKRAREQDLFLEPELPAWARGGRY